MTALTLAIKKADEIIGIICFHPFDTLKKSASLGYWIAEKHQGKGIITSTAQVLIEYGFNEIGLNEVKLSFATFNARSQAVAKRLGFKRSELIAQKEWLYNRHIDHIFYLMSKEKWKKLKRIPSFRRDLL